MVLTVATYREVLQGKFAAAHQVTFAYVLAQVGDIFPMAAGLAARRISRLGQRCGKVGAFAEDVQVVRSSEATDSANATEGDRHADDFMMPFPADYTPLRRALNRVLVVLVERI